MTFEDTQRYLQQTIQISHRLYSRTYIKNVWTVEWRNPTFLSHVLIPQRSKKHDEKDYTFYLYFSQSMFYLSQSQ
jgi:hypothetical protein